MFHDQARNHCHSSFWYCCISAMTFPVPNQCRQKIQQRYKTLIPSSPRLHLSINLRSPNKSLWIIDETNSTLACYCDMPKKIDLAAICEGRQIAEYPLHLHYPLHWRPYLQHQYPPLLQHQLPLTLKPHFHMGNCFQNSIPLQHCSDRQTLIRHHIWNYEQKVSSTLNTTKPFALNPTCCHMGDCHYHPLYQTSLHEKIIGKQIATTGNGKS
jgi:hypothetical protein